MAIFEKRYYEKQILDDTEAINCVIETAQEVNGHTEYVLRLQRGLDKDRSWKILRRYNDFAELHKCLCVSGIDLPMPGKRIFGNMRPSFIAERRQALQDYINAVLMNPILASSLPAKRFVDPDSYSQSFHDYAVQNVLMCLRTEGWTLGTTMGPIGWRIRKHYFKVSPKPPDKAASKLLVKSASQTQQSKHFSASSSVSNGSSSSGGGSMEGNTSDSPKELVLEWLEYGPDKYLEYNDFATILKSLMGLQHPYIEKIVFATHNESGCLIIRRFHKHGTLKDILCMSTPKKPFLSKYGNPKGRTALTMKQLVTYGRQILEALIFLHSKGYPYGHLHSGNIAIVDDCVKLLDIENYILGVPAFYRPFFVQHSKIHSIETVEVYCFGHVLFEMAMGYPLQESVVRQINDCPDALKNVLESILSKEACRFGLPTLEQLINHEFFKPFAAASSSSSNAISGGGDGSDEISKPHFKISLNTKELLQKAIRKCETRLRDEQKSVKNQKRTVRVQEFMSFQEEKRKLKHRAKLEHKQSKLTQQSSLQTNNGRLGMSSASSSVEAMKAATFNRSDSVLSVHLSQDGGGPSTSIAAAAATAHSDSVKSPPPSPSIAQYRQQQEQQQQKQHGGASSSNALNIERQSSSPNICTDGHSHESPSEPPIRSALLESICKFNRGSLRKVRSND